MAMESKRFFILIFLALAEITFNQAHKWTYTGDSGPSYWHELFPKDCAGSHQSPINIRPEDTTQDPNLKDFAIWYDPPKPDSKMFIKNNGHTVQVDLEGDFFVANGGLSHVYKALQFHFHWGHKEHHGSEHLIDGVPGPIEMHLVTYNHEVFSEISEALVTQGGLAVLGTMYEISDEDNPNLATIVRALKHIRNPEQYDKIDLPLMSLRDFLPKDISRYYRYNGSLTVPGCFESVIWTVFDEKQTISPRQLKEFTLLLENRKHKKAGGHAGNRHRRSLNKEERKTERRAEKVLDELGIRGNHFQEAALKFELLNMQMMGDMPDNTAVEKKTSEEDELDNKENADTKYDKEHDDTTDNKEHVKDDEEHADDHHTEGKAVEAEMEEYTQDVLVNNFRPVQPLNDRVVYRNFNLRPPVRIQYYDTPARSAESSDGGDNGATYHKLSLPAIVTVLLFTLVLAPAL